MQIKYQNQEKLIKRITLNQKEKRSKRVPWNSQPRRFLNQK